MPVSKFFTLAPGGNYTVTGNKQVAFACSLVTQAPYVPYPTSAHRVTRATMTFSQVTSYSQWPYYALANGAARGSYAGSFYSDKNSSGHSISVSCSTGSFPAYGGYYGTTSLGVQGNNAATSGTPLSIRATCIIGLEVVWEYGHSPVTAPTGLALAAGLSEGNVNLSISGAKAGTENPIRGYRVEYRDSSNASAWGSWQLNGEYATTSTSYTLSVPPPGTRGHYHQFRAKTLGKVAGYDSASYKESGSLRKNSVPTAPTKVEATPRAGYESGNLTISIGGATDGDNNITRYQINRRRRLGGTWESWQTLTENAGTSYSNNPGIGRGEEVNYQAAAIDAFGLKSGFTTGNYVTRNRTPLAPGILYPGANRTTYNKSPYVRVKIQAEPDGNSQTLYSQVGSQGAVNHGAKGAGEHRINLANLAYGNNTVKLWLTDSLGAKGPEISVVINLAYVSMPRAISSSVLLFDSVGSKSASDDLTQLLARLNNLLTYYGEPRVAFTQSTKHFHTWMDNITVLRGAVNKINGKIGKSTNWLAASSGPSAQVINQIINLLPSL